MDVLAVPELPVRPGNLRQEGGQFLIVMPSLDLVMVLTHDTFHDAVMPIGPHLSPHEFVRRS